MAILEKTPAKEETAALLGKEHEMLWNQLCSLLDSRYKVDKIWYDDGKNWDCECKYRRGGKTLCSLFAKKDTFGLMIIFGKAEREKFEGSRERFSSAAQKIYDEATTYHDGKWMLFMIEDNSLFSDFEKLLAIKRRPNKKQ